MMEDRNLLLSEDTRTQGRTWRKSSLAGAPLRYYVYYVSQILFVHILLCTDRASQTEAQNKNVQVWPQY